MQERGVRVYQPRNGSTEEISICLRDLVDLVLVYFGSTFCQVELKHGGIFENLMNPYGFGACEIWYPDDRIKRIKHTRQTQIKQTFDASNI